MEEKTTSAHIHGKEITFKTGKIARQANGAVLLTCGDTHILASACGNKTANPDCDFLPLRVDYQEKQSSAGKTLGGFIKREGRPTESQTLVSRLIDRPIRPMFPAGYFNEVQLLIYVLSYDDNHPPEPLAITAASAALVMSDIPFPKPLAGVRVGMIGDEFIINPSIAQMKESKLDLLLAGTNDAILMIEGYCDFLTEEQVVAAIDEGHEAIKEITQTLSDWQNVAGKEKFTPELTIPEDYILEEIEKEYTERLEAIFAIKGKAERESAQKEVEEAIKETYLNCDQPKCKPLAMKIAIKKTFAKILRNKVLREKKRSDGRTPMEIRPIYAETSLLPRTHGDALFTRGETQTIAVCTLGGDSMGQRYENLEGDFTRKFYLQYSFPPFSVGECGRVGPPGRREIGHGKLAERALECVLPDADKFPYTIRLESNITESNGSSSMASVCGGSMALMDAGVPIKKPVAGIAMGMIVGKDNTAILSDIRGEEDFMGDMDFKTAGTSDGITACQMDMKVQGISFETIEEALEQAHKGRLHILGEMAKTISSPKESISQYAPQFLRMEIDGSDIGAVIGPGGKVIQTLQKETGTEIMIEEDDKGKGQITISANDLDKAEEAKKRIKMIVGHLEEGATYKGVVKSIKDFGAFVEVAPGKDGLLHISEIDHTRVEKVTDYPSLGDEIEVKLLKVEHGGKLRLSRKALIEKED